MLGKEREYIRLKFSDFCFSLPSPLLLVVPLLHARVGYNPNCFQAFLLPLFHVSAIF